MPPWATPIPAARGDRMIEMIGDDTPLFGEPDSDGLGLDSVDALELMLVFEKDFGISIDTEEIDPEAFGTVATLEAFLEQTREAQGVV